MRWILAVMPFLVAIILGTLGLLKCWTTGGAIWWLRRYGSMYRGVLQRHHASELSGRVIRAIVDECHGQRVWPWGVLDYRLYRRSALWRYFGRRIYRLTTLGPVALALYVLLYSTACEGLNPVVWSCVAIVYQCGAILMTFEGVYAYIAIGNYRRHYHVGIRLPDDGKPNAEDDMYEIDVLLPIVTSAICINVLAFLTAQTGWDAFHSPEGAKPANLASLGLQALYFVSTTLITVGYGDIFPKNSLGQVVTILMHAQSLLLITGMFSSLMSFGLRTKDDSN